MVADAGNNWVEEVGANNKVADVRHRAQVDVDNNRTEDNNIAENNAMMVVDAVK
jgi:hypothetical protein